MKQLLMSRDEWHKAYVERMVMKGVERDFAEQAYAAVVQEYDEDPVEMADEEMSNWGDI